MTQVAKSDAFSLLNFGSVDDMNFALVELGDHLVNEGQTPGDELINPDKYEDIDSNTLKLLRSKMQEALDRPVLTEVKTENTDLVSKEPAEVLATNTDYNRDRLSGLTTVLTQLGFEVGMMVGTALSEEKWDAIEEAYEQNDQRRLSEFVQAHRGEFESVESLLTRIDKKRSSRRVGTLGKLTELGKLDDLSSRRKQVLSR
jgi:hypothetical protein